MSETIIKQEIKKADSLIISAQQELDSAKKNKAPQGTIKHLEQRVKALKGRKVRFEKALSKYGEPVISEGQPIVKKNTATPSGKKGDKKAGDE